MQPQSEDQVDIGAILSIAGLVVLLVPEDRTMTLCLAVLCCSAK